MSNPASNNQKSNAVFREEAVLDFWKEKSIFKKSLEKNKGGKEFVFFEGPPTANAKPALHHLEARAFKDVIPRYKTMQGFSVARRAGWDTHGLPVELQIEKKLGLTSKKDIEKYGIKAFNKECKDSVFTYIKDWEFFTDRIGYWVDKDHAYYTFDPSYMESVWNIVAEVDKKGLLYKDYKIVPWCARCGTTLASHELAQEYQDDKDLSVYAKFPIVGFGNAYFVAWTTTPWTLPGNVALAVGGDITYVEAKVGQEIVVIAKDRLALLSGEYEILAEHKGSEMAEMEYRPLYAVPQLASGASYKVQVADFVTTTDGTGIVHIAPMYGADDFALATKNNLPKVHTVDEAGHFIAGIDFLEGRFVKDEEVAVDIIKDLAHRGLLFKKEKYEHSYPHCWRCKTPLIYYARDSWYFRMEELRKELIAENEKVHWEPAHIKDGRFGEWLRGDKDWAISRERYWGTPLPIWANDAGERMVVDSVDTLKRYATTSGNTYYAIRHGEAVHNLEEIWSCMPGANDALTEKGKEQVRANAEALKGKIDIIISSPFVRTQETARIIAQTLGIADIVTDERIGEWNVGSEYDSKLMDDYFKVRNKAADRYQFKTVDGESYADVFTRTGAFLYELERNYQGKRILVVTHGGPSRAMELVAHGFAYDTLFETTRDYRNFDNAEVRQIDFIPLPHNEQYELDLHRPYIDEVVLEKDGKEYRRVKEVMDVWLDSGSMPFAQDHYPFEHADDLPYPADFISEAIDQTRGWFYTLLAVGVLMGRGAPYKNVICLGHLLDKDGKKMSKSVGNIVEPFEQIEKFGVDAIRYWMYSVNQSGESKNYDEKSIAEINNKVFNLLGNIHSFYDLYRDTSLEGKSTESTHVLDQWIMARLNQTIETVTKGLDVYDLFTPTRTIREFCDDLSTWYLRRSRDRLKDEDMNAKRTLYVVLKTVAQLLAPFAPFFAEDMWQKLKIDGDEESVHLSVWPKSDTRFAGEVIGNMQTVRDICAEGNALRKKAGIAVRQPLAKLVAKEWNLGDEYDELVMEELNVKAVVAGEETMLDTDITPELKLEGDYRELVRTIQDLRKEKGLQPQDEITLTLPASAQEIVEKFGKELQKTVGANKLLIEGEEVSIG
ncbi:class I tRNA ligase family protein [Candidatus Nomurabacteria bacterium]|nr:class I tRNA ligase family protein [Candidatus Nomurabacteria bacterium]